MDRGKVRKQRSDKKRDVKPTLKIELKDAIYRMARVTNTYVKDAAEQMIQYALTSEDIIERLSKSFIRDIRIRDTVIRGHLDNKRVERCDTGPRERLTVRLKQSTYDSVMGLSYALDVNPARVCAILIHEAMRDFDFLAMYIKNYFDSQLNTHNLNEVYKILDYINQDVNTEITLASLLDALMREVNTPIKRDAHNPDGLVIHHWKERQ